MPLARIRVVLFGTNQQLSDARDALTAQYPAADRIFSRSDGQIIQIPPNRRAVTMDIRLNTQGDGDALRDRAVGIVQTLRSIGVQGRINYHQCTHDDAVVTPCAGQTVVL